MLEINIPGRGTLQLYHLVSDVNGTLATDGQIQECLIPIIKGLRDCLEIHLLTADTHGKQAIINQQLGLQAVRIHAGAEAEQKAAYVRNLGSGHVVAIGQGANDTSMLKEAALGICILSPEGTATTSLLASDLVVADTFTALGLLEKPLRIVASLRK